MDRPRTSSADPFDLQRFVDAQRESYDIALTELRNGAKRSHWMWYVFPQFEGLGSSEISRHYAVRSLAEARAYLAHPLLGPRLRECVEAVLHLAGLSARDVFGTVDALKLRSSATLFGSVSPAGSVFHRLLEQYFDGLGDPRTLE